MQRFLMTNGLGGYSALTAHCATDRCDAGLLVAALRAPDLRINLVHRVRETLYTDALYTLSSQDFADGTPPEQGGAYLCRFSREPELSWEYRVGDLGVTRVVSLAYGENTLCLCYRVENKSEKPCTFTAEPFFRLTPKEEPLLQPVAVCDEGNAVKSGGYTLYINANVPHRLHPARWQKLAYPEDEKDGRPGWGLTFSTRSYTLQVAAGQTQTLRLVFSACSAASSGAAVLDSRRQRREALLKACFFTHPVARQLYMAADDFIVRRDSTRGKTVIAGYPLFSDWGRDTMIALTGCVLTTRRYDDAREILRTFLAYEKDGLVPNLFPEGGSEPRYNTVDAALLLIDCVYQYLCRTGDLGFVREAFPVLERIIAAYRRGTRHGIAMDSDGLIMAGKGLDQVTWMDVCVDGVLPTPRHGKPVEINAYWYNALRIMDELARQLQQDPKDWAQLARQVKASFIEKFYMPHRGYLKDVVSGTQADIQLRCNQIWAVCMSFGMLTKAQARAVLRAVKEHLYTPRGLRTLSPADPQYHGFYGGSQFDRDMAYHQGTVWVFPMGAFCRGWLQVYGRTPSVIQQVKDMLSDMENMLEEGCMGQLPEIYDGDHPRAGKGCYAQAWSVGEMLRVYELLEQEEVEGNG